MNEMKIDIPDSAVAVIEQQASNAQEPPRLLTEGDLAAELADIDPQIRPEFEQVWWPEIVKQNVRLVNLFLDSGRKKHEAAARCPVPVLDPPPKTDLHSPLFGRKHGLREAAALLGVSKTQLRRLVTDGSIPTIRVGNRYRFREDDLIAWLEGHYGLVRKPTSVGHLPPLPRSVVDSPLLKRAG